MRRLRLAVVVVAIGGSAVACSLIVSTSGLSGGSAEGLADAADGGADMGPGVDATSDTSPNDAGVDGDASVHCPSGRGPVMVDMGRFCIDSTEITQAQYDAFVGGGVLVSSQPTECSGNNSFIPDSLGGCSGRYDPQSTPTKPVVCVDWCDALAFCTWAGRRLCGGIGGTAVTEGAVTDPAASEWMAACTNDGRGAYPYGNTFNASACNGPDKGAGATLPVGSLASCEGGYKGLFDMAGNVTEMDHSCWQVDGGALNCTRRGGSYDPSSNAKCSFALQGALDLRTNFLGFRCCADRF